MWNRFLGHRDQRHGRSEYRCHPWPNRSRGSRNVGQHRNSPAYCSKMQKADHRISRGKLAQIVISLLLLLIIIDRLRLFQIVSSSQFSIEKLSLSPCFLTLSELHASNVRDIREIGGLVTKLINLPGETGTSPPSLPLLSIRFCEEGARSEARLSR
jgi:hypothetical protein